MGGPPPRSLPCGQLLLEIRSHPWVSTRRRFHDSEQKPLEDQLNTVIVAFVRIAAGLREFALQKAVERRQEMIAERCRRNEEQRRKELEPNVERLEPGMERRRWRRSAREFLAFLKTQGPQRPIDHDRFSAWMQWAEQYVEDGGLDAFFAPWRTKSGAAIDPG